MNFLTPCECYKKCNIEWREYELWHRMVCLDCKSVLATIYIKHGSSAPVLQWPREGRRVLNSEHWLSELHGMDEWIEEVLEQGMVV